MRERTTKAVRRRGGLADAARGSATPAEAARGSAAPVGAARASEPAGGVGADGGDRVDAAIVVPTKDAGPEFAHLCRHLAELRARYGVDVLIIDSGSGDSTVSHAEAAGLRTHRIPPAEFGHGRTRNLGVRLTTGDIVCFLSQDVLPCTPDWPVRFAEALAEPGVAGVYGRQVPRDASTMEMFFVSLNYPEQPLRFRPQPGGHHPRPGRVLFSNAFSALRRDVALEVSLPADAQYSEDQIWAHQALAAGYSIAYEPRAEALHAHAYSLAGLFRRSYCVGRALREVGIAGGASFGESLRFLAREIRYFVRQGHAHRLPQLLPYEFLRWAGFQMGRRLPRTLGWSAGGSSARADGETGAERSRPVGGLLARLPGPLGGDHILADVVRGASSVFSLRVLGTVLAVALNVVLARLLGPDGAGLFFLAVTVVTIAAVVGRVGLDNAVLRFAAASAARNEWRSLAGVERLGLGVAVVGSGVLTLVVMAAAPWIAATFFGEPALGEPLRIAAVAIIPFSLVVLHAELLKSIERAGRAVAGRVVAMPLVAIPLVALLAPRLGVLGAVVAYVASVLCALAVTRRWWRRALPRLREVRGEFDLGRLLRTSAPLFWVAGLDLVMTMTDTVVLGAVRGAEDVGTYGVAARTALLMAFALVSVNTIAAPKFAALHARGDRESVARLARRATALMTLVTAPMLLAFLVLPSTILGLLYGQEFVAGAGALVVLSVGQFLAVVAGPVGYLLMMCGEEKALRNVTVLAAALNLALNVILVPGYGIVGAAAATAASLVALNAGAAVVAYRRLSIVAVPLLASYGRTGR